MDSNASSSQTHSAAAATGTDREVKRYERNRKIIVALTLAFTVLCMATIWAKYTYATVSYKGLTGPEKLGGKIATDSSGNSIIATIISDSTFRFILSNDSGLHFEAMGSSFIYNSPIEQIAFAPDNKSIIAVTYDGLYIKTADNDSFFHIPCKNDLGLFENVNGFTFVPHADSVYVYGGGSNKKGTSILAFNYKKPSKLTLYKISDISWEVSQLVFSKAGIIAVAKSSIENKGTNIIFRGLKFPGSVDYTVDEFQKISFINNTNFDTATAAAIADSLAAAADTARVTIDTTLKAMDTAKKADTAAFKY